MKTKLLYPLIILLVITNIVLIFILLKKPHKRPMGADSFLIEKLEFSKEQAKEFKALDKHHRNVMIGYDEAILDYKKQMFEFISNNKEVDMAIISKIGNLEGKKEEEIFRFFSEVRKLCSEDQGKKLNDILRKILSNNPKGPRNQPPPPMK